MKNISREKYEEIFSATKNLNAVLDPHEIIIEFAIAAIEAPKSNFQNANIKGCFFRFAQTNWRKIHSVGLAVEYQESAEIRNLLKCFASLALIPETGASFLPKVWCPYANAKEMRQKTDNAVEGWHRAIKGSLGYVHPSIFKFVEFLRREQSAAENKLIALQAGNDFPKSDQYQKNAQRIQNILQQYQNNRIELIFTGLAQNCDFV